MLTILVVDDNVHLQIAFKKILTSSGYRVELAGDGEEGLRLALSTQARCHPARYAVAETWWCRGASRLESRSRDSEQFR